MAVESNRTRRCSAVSRAETFVSASSSKGCWNVCARYLKSQNCFDWLVFRSETSWIQLTSLWYLASPGEDDSGRISSFITVNVSFSLPILQSSYDIATLDMSPVRETSTATRALVESSQHFWPSAESIIVTRATTAGSIYKVVC